MNSLIWTQTRKGQNPSYLACLSEDCNEFAIVCRFSVENVYHSIVYLNDQPSCFLEDMPSLEMAQAQVQIEVFKLRRKQREQGGIS